MKRFLCRDLFLQVAVSGLTLFGSGCAGTFDKVHVLTPGQPPAETPGILVLQQIQVTDSKISGAEGEILAHAIHRGIEDYGKKHNGLATAVATAGTNEVANSLLLSGTVT